LGTCLYLLLTDAFPYAGAFDFEAISGERFDHPLVPPSRLNIRVDPYLDSLVVRCLAPNPHERIQDAVRLLEELQRWKPAKARGEGKSLEGTEFSDTPKSGLGYDSALDEQTARAMIKDALQLARSVGKLNDAADLLEEALNKWPQLRADYAYKIQIWRKGIAG
jgi:serine/threonine-protein kinase